MIPAEDAHIIMALVGLLILCQPVLIVLGQKRSKKLESIDAHLAKINGKLIEHQGWIDGHEKYATEVGRRLNGIEDRERKGRTR